MRAISGVLGAKGLTTLLLVFWIWGAPLEPASAQGQHTDTSIDATREGDYARIRVEDRGAESGGKAFLRIVLPDDLRADRPVVFGGEILSPSDLGSVEVVLEVRDAGGVVVAESTIRTTAAPGSTPLRFEWNTGGLPDGEYAGSVSLFGDIRSALARQTFIATKRSGVNVEEALEQARGAAEDLRRYIEGEAVDTGTAPGLIRGRLALFEEALQHADSIRSDWFETYDLATYVLDSVKGLNARWVSGSGILERSGMTGLPPLDHLVSEDGRFVSRGRPLFLAGLVTGADPAGIKRIGDYGLGLALVFDVPDIDAAGWARRASQLDMSAGTHNVALIPILSQEDRSPEDLADLSKGLSGHRMFAAVGLSGRPRVDIASPEMRTGFIERVKQTYKDRFEVNQAWRKRLASYDEIEIWPDYDRGPYQYDWQMYLRDTVTAKIEKNSEALRGSLPRTPVMTVLDGDVLVPGETRRGLDRETLLSSVQASGLVTSDSLADPVFGMAYPDQTLLYALQRSIAPRAPLVVVHRVEFAGMEDRDLFRDMQAFVWESAIEGVAALALDVGSSTEGPKLPATAEFQILDGLITAAEDVNRLAGIIDAFRQDRARVAILWSESSRILDGGKDHLASVRRAYEGSSFAGHKVRFLTESQLAGGELEGIDLLILPETLALSQDAFEALQALLDTGLPAIRSTFVIPYDSRGRAQTDMISFGPATGLVRGNDASTEYMEAMDEALSRNRLPEVPRVTNGYGYPVEGVKTRYVEYGGERFLYLINLRKEAVTCHLTGGLSGGLDLIGGSDVEFPRSVRPIEPMLIRLNRADS